MAPIASEESAGIEGSKLWASEPDPFRQIVQIALAIYLTPVVAIVCAIGGISILFDKASQVAGRVATKPTSAVKPNHLPVNRSNWAGMKSPHSRDPRRIRV